MFREIIFPIFRSTRLCVTTCGIMHRRCCRPKAGNIVGALYQHAMRMRRIWSVACLSLPNFSTSHKRHEFRKMVIEHKMCILIFCTNFVWNISHSKTNWARYDQKCISVLMWSTCYSCPILIKLEFSRHFFSENTQIPNFMKILTVGAEPFHAARRTDVYRRS